MNKKFNSVLLNILDELNIPDKLYYSDEAFNIIVNIYDKLDIKFKEALDGIDYLKLHCYLLEEYSDNINKLGNLKGFELEKHKDFLNIIEYFIELNLINNSITNSKEVNIEDIKYIYNIVQFLYHLQISRGIINFTKKCADNTKAIKFRYVDIDRKREEPIKFPSSEEYKNDYNNYIIDNKEHKYYMSNDDFIKILSDDSVFKELDKTLKINSKTLIHVLMFFANMQINNNPLSDFKNTYRNNLIYNHVYKINYEDFIKYLGKKFNNIKSVIDFILLCPDKIKYITRIDNKEYKKIEIKKEIDFLSIDNKSSRDNRFELNPILLVNNDIIFSLESFKKLYNIWAEAIPMFHLPHKQYIISDFQKILDSKKECYEKKLVSDIKDTLDNKGYDSKTNIDIYSITKDNKYKYLGDYDIIGINNDKKEIILIEAKLLIMSYDESDVINKQKEYYGIYQHIRNEKMSIDISSDLLPDERFYRRILYMENNYKKLLPMVNIKIDSNLEYKIKSYMIFNRYFKPLFKELNFKVLSFHEFKELLEKESIIT